MSARPEFPPWTLKQVPTEARSAAIMAARRANEPIGAWVGRVLLEAAQRELTGGRALAPIVNGEEAPAAVAGASLDELAQIAGRLAELPDDGPAGRFKRSAFRALQRGLATKA